MANIATVKKIAAGQKPDASENAYLISTNEVKMRMGAGPIDATDVFMNPLSAQAYAEGTLVTPYQHHAQAYVGQRVAVVDEALSTTNVYIIENEAGSLRKVTASPLSGMDFDFDGKTLGEVLANVISALGGNPLNYE